MRASGFKAGMPHSQPQKTREKKTKCGLRPSPRPQPQGDILFRHELMSFLSGGRQNRYENARAATAAENKFLLPIKSVSAG